MGGSSRTARYLEALEKTTVGGQWQRGGAPGQLGTGVELARVSVPPAKAQGWVVTLNAPPRAVTTDDDTPMSGKPVSQHIGRTIAVIEWGNGGVSASVEIDWAQGGVYNFFGSEVRVTVLAPDVFFSGSVNAALRLSNLQAFIAPGVSRAMKTPTRTVYYATLQQGAQQAQAIPRFAKRAWPYTTNTPTAMFEMFFTTRSGATIEARFVYQTSTDRRFLNPQSPVVVPCNATELIMEAQTGVLSSAVQYELCI